MKSGRRLLWIISYHHACNDGTLMALVALLPIFLKQFELTLYEVGLLGSGLLITVVVQYEVGRFADRMFSRYLLELGAALMGMSFLLMLMVNNFEGLFLAVISMRVGGAFYHPVGTSWITREYAGPYLETALGVQSGVGNFGVIIALATSGFIGDMFTWRAVCVLWAALNLSAVLLGTLLVKEGMIKTRVVRKKATTSSRVTLGKMMFLIIPIVTGGALYQITSTFGPINLTTRTLDWNAGSADLIFALWIGIGTVTSYYFGGLSARVGKYQLLRMGYLVSLIAVIILAVTTDWRLITPTLFVFGAFLFVTYPALFSMITELTGEEERGTAFGILFGFQLGGGAVSVYVCGFIGDRLHSPQYSFLFAGALAAASLIMITLWETHIRKLAQNC
jgi:MFS family permease